MKHVLLFLLTLTALKSQALMVNRGESNTLDNCWEGRTISGYKGYWGSYDAICYMTMSSISLPTILVEGQSLDLNSDEASDRLSAEVEGTVQPVLLNQIAKANNLSLQVVREVAAGLSDLTLKNLVLSLSK
jgi:hypothetical protein